MISYEKKYSINENTYLGSDLVNLIEVTPINGNIASLNILFKPKMAKISKPGVYAVFFDNILLYLGKYQGTSKDAFGGCVNRERWCKHLATITLRGKKVSCKPSTLQKVKNEPNLKSAFYDFLGEFDEDVFVGDRGCVTVLPRIQFAINNWKEFENLTSQDLARFKFHYISFENKKATSTGEYREVITDLEDKFIEKFHPLLNVKGKDPSKTKIVNIEQYKLFLKNNLTPLEKKNDIRKKFKNSKIYTDKDIFDIENDNLNLFISFMEGRGLDPQFIEESINYLDSDTSLNYYFTDIPDFRITGIIGAYKNGNPNRRVLITIKLPKKKRELKVNVFLPIEHLDRSLQKLSRTVRNTIPTEISIPFMQLNTHSDLLVRIISALKSYYNL